MFQSTLFQTIHRGLNRTEEHTTFTQRLHDRPLLIGQLRSHSLLNTLHTDHRSNNIFKGKKSKFRPTLKSQKPSPSNATLRITNNCLSMHSSIYSKISSRASVHNFMFSNTILSISIALTKGGKVRIVSSFKKHIGRLSDT